MCILGAASLLLEGANEAEGEDDTLKITANGGDTFECGIHEASPTRSADRDAIL